MTPPPVTPASPTPPPPPIFNLRLGYRTVVGPQIGHGLQLAFTPTIRISPEFRFAPTTEINLMPYWDGIRTDAASMDAAVGAGGGPRESGYTDITGGTRDRLRLHHYQVVQYLNFFWRPSQSFPFEMGIRFALGFENTADRTTITPTSDPARYPGEHVGAGGCIPGDIYCPSSPIPGPSTSPYPPSSSEADHWNFFVRGGFRINFPFHPVIRVGAELLFQANTQSPTGPDPFLRFPVTLTAPIHRNFQLQAEPRLIVRFVEPVVTFDLVAGIVALF